MLRMVKCQVQPYPLNYTRKSERTGSWSGLLHMLSHVNRKHTGIQHSRKLLLNFLWPLHHPGKTCCGCTIVNHTKEKENIPILMHCSTQVVYSLSRLPRPPPPTTQPPTLSKTVHLMQVHRITFNSIHPSASCILAGLRFFVGSPHPPVCRLTIFRPIVICSSHGAIRVNVKQVVIFTGKSSTSNKRYRLFVHVGLDWYGRGEKNFHEDLEHKYQKPLLSWLLLTSRDVIVWVTCVNQCTCVFRLKHVSRNAESRSTLTYTSLTYVPDYVHGF